MALFFLKLNPQHAAPNPNKESITYLALFSIIFFVAALTAIIFTAIIGGYLFIIGWVHFWESGEEVHTYFLKAKYLKESVRIVWKCYSTASFQLEKLNKN